MIQRAYLVGCSHVSGSELEGWGIADNTEFNLRNSFAAQLAIKLGYEPVNLGFPGGSNDYIFRNCYELLNKVNANDVIFAFWTGAERIEIYDELQKKWMNFSVGMSLQQAEHHDIHREFYRVYHKLLCDNEHRRGELNKIRNIIAANAAARQRGIRLINHDNFWALDFPERQDYAWIKPDTTFMTWAEGTKYQRSPWYHYELAAHTEYAEILYNDIIARNLLKHAGSN